MEMDVLTQRSRAGVAPTGISLLTRRVVDLAAPLLVERRTARAGVGLAAGVVAVAVAAAGPASAQDRTAPDRPWPPVATFSVLGYDPDTGEVGVAVQSRVFSVGNGVIWGKADVGVVATQAVVDVGYGPRGLELLEEGLAPEQVVERLLLQQHLGQPRADQQANA